MWTLFLFLTIIISHSYADTKCQLKNYKDGDVCVCDSQYCDTISTPALPGEMEYILYTSNKAGLRFEQSKGQFKKDDFLSDYEITINSNEVYQNINGFGGAFTDAFGINVQSLSPDVRQHLMRSYFSSDGIEYSLCRVPIGGTDFSTRGYSYNDGVEDKELKNFKLAEEDFKYKIPLINEAKELSNNHLKFFASAWTAPKWMKTNNDYSGLGFLKQEMYQSWANYHLKFLEKYREEGIDFWGITTGNEPSLAMVPFGKINSVGWWPKQMSQYVSENLGPTLRESDFKNIKIIAIDDQRFNLLPFYLNTILSNNITNNYIDGIGVHWYWNYLFSAKVLKLTHDNYPEKFILATEACNGAGSEVHVLLGSWERGEKYATDIIENLNNWSTGWIDWNMALDEQGGPTYIQNYVDAPIIVNASANEFYKQPTFYVLGHFSKFLPNNSTVRIHSKSFDSTNVPVVAFKRSDGKKVVILLNKKNEQITVNIVDELIGSANIDIPPKSINTLLY